MLSRRAIVLVGLLVLGVLTTSVRGVNDGDQSAEMAQETPNKSRWPEVVGKTYDEAKEIILREAPDVTVQRVPEGSFVTMDYVPGRVRIWVDLAGLVREPEPQRG